MLTLTNESVSPNGISKVGYVTDTNTGAITCNITCTGVCTGKKLAVLKNVKAKHFNLKTMPKYSLNKLSKAMTKLLNIKLDKATATVVGQDVHLIAQNSILPATMLHDLSADHYRCQAKNIIITHNPENILRRLILSSGVYPLVSFLNGENYLDFHQTIMNAPLQELLNSINKIPIEIQALTPDFDNLYVIVFGENMILHPIQVPKLNIPGMQEWEDQLFLGAVDKRKMTNKYYIGRNVWGANAVLTYAEPQLVNYNNFFYLAKQRYAIDIHGKKYALPLRMYDEYSSTDKIVSKNYNQYTILQASKYSQVIGQGTYIELSF